MKKIINQNKNIKNKTNDVVILTGAGQIGMAIARTIGYGKKIMIGDENTKNAQDISKTMNNARFDTVSIEMDLSSRKSILNMIDETKKYGNITMLFNSAGVSPSQASIETIL